MYQRDKIHAPFPTVYVDDTAHSDANQTVKLKGIGKILGRIRSDGDITPPKNDRSVIGAALAADFILRQIDRAGRILDGGEIIQSITTAMNTSSYGDMASWVTMNAPILGIVGYLLYPSAKRIVATIHKWTAARYTWLKSRRNAEGKHG